VKPWPGAAVVGAGATANRRVRFDATVSGLDDPVKLSNNAKKSRYLANV
jgi:hypothetical protein